MHSTVQFSNHSFPIWYVCQVQHCSMSRFTRIVQFDYDSLETAAVFAIPPVMVMVFDLIVGPIVDKFVRTT